MNYNSEELKQRRQCGDAAKSLLLKFVDVATKQVKNFQDGVQNLSNTALSGLDYAEEKTILKSGQFLLQSQIDSATRILNNPECGIDYESFLLSLHAYVSGRKQNLDLIKIDREKYSACADQINDIYTALDNIEDIKGMADRYAQESQEFTEQMRKKMYADRIDDALQDKYIEKFADKIKKLIQNARSIHTYTSRMPTLDDQARILLTKNDLPFLYMTARSGVSPEDPVKDGYYTITIMGSIPVTFKGDYDKLKYFVDLFEQYPAVPDEDAKWHAALMQDQGLTEYGLDAALLAIY